MYATTRPPSSLLRTCICSQSCHPQCPYCIFSFTFGTNSLSLALTSLPQAELLIPIHSRDRTANACMRTFPVHGVHTNIKGRRRPGSEKKVFDQLYMIHGLRHSCAPVADCILFRVSVHARRVLSGGPVRAQCFFRACVAHRSLCSIGHVQVCRELGVAVSLCLCVFVVRFVVAGMFGGCS